MVEDTPAPDLLPDPERQRLLDALAGIGKAIAFAAGGSGPAVLPGLHVEGVGPVGLPVDEVTARSLVAAAQRAPFGLGEATVVDEEVRNTWQIEPERLRFDNPGWEPAVAKLVGRVLRAFELDGPVRHELYKLLVYERGGHFAPHVDSEKVDGMFATLVVVLPSRHEGGRLVVRHAGRERAFAHGGERGAFTAHWAAFYTDCEHELEPVTAGHRVALVYNLVREDAGRVHAPAYGAEATAVADALTMLFEEVGHDRLVISLAHEYSEAGLRPSALKGADRARWQILRQVADELDLEMHLALLEHRQHGDADEEHLFYSGRRGRRGWWDQDLSDAQMGEIHGEAVALDHWVGTDGRARKLGRMEIDLTEIVRDAEAVPFFEQEVHGPTGNAGIEMERWYRETVFVLWPRARFGVLLAREGPAVAVPVLAQQVAKAEDPAADPALLRFAAATIDHWGAGWLHRERNELVHTMLDTLTRLADPELAAAFIRQVLPEHLTAAAGSGLRELCRSVGWSPCREELLALVPRPGSSRRLSRMSAYAETFAALCGEEGKALEPEQRALCAEVARAMAQAIVLWDQQSDVNWQQRDALDRRGVLAPLARCLAASGELEHLSPLVEHALAEPAAYGLREVLVPAALALQAPDDPALRGDPAVRALREHCVTALREAVAEPPTPPSDWSRPADLSRKGALYDELRAFAADPEAETHRFKVARDARNDLRHAIDHARLDMDYRTDRKGRPYTLVCTKNQASYERQRRQFEADREALAALEG